MPAFIPIILAIGGTAIRVTSQAVAKHLMKQGAKKVSKEAAKKLKPGGTANTVADATKIVQKAKPTTPARLAQKPKGDVVEGTARVVTKPGTQVATQGSRAVKKPGTGVQQVRQVKDKKPPMKNITPKKKAVPNKTKPAAKKSSAVKKAAGAAAALAAVTAMIDKAKDKKATASAAPKAKPKMPLTKPKDIPGKSGPIKTKKAPSRTEMGSAAGKPPKRSTRPPLGGPSAGGKKKAISAGANTGFGPKGNMFPGSAKERAAYMLMYGGTGSAAAKAAMAGKQGNIELGRKALKRAKKERLSKRK